MKISEYQHQCAGDWCWRAWNWWKGSTKWVCEWSFPSVISFRKKKDNKCIWAFLRWAFQSKLTKLLGAKQSTGTSVKNWLSINYPFWLTSSKNSSKQCVFPTVFRTSPLTLNCFFSQWRKVFRRKRRISALIRLRVHWRKWQSTKMTILFTANVSTKMVNSFCWWSIRIKRNKL